MRKPIGKQKNAVKANVLRRKLAIRKKLNGNSERPRLCISKSNKNVFIQAVDDASNVTLFSIQTFGKNSSFKGVNMKNAKEVGEKVASELQDRKISSAIYDRNGRKYTGILAAVAEGIRSKGIQL